MTPENPGGRLRDRVLGQERVFRQWELAEREERLPHATLLLGPRGCGKGRTALALAQHLLCGREDRPCGACPTCRKVERLIHPDLHLLIPATREELENPEAMAKRIETYATDRLASWDLSGNASIGIDQVRRLKEEMAKAGVEGDRRVVCFLGADRMTEQAAQSALKLVEEPPAQAFLILTAEDPSQLLPTLVSRCQRLRLSSLSREALVEILSSELGSSMADASLLAALSGGSLGQALEMREVGLEVFRDRVLKLFHVDADSGLDLSEVERRVQWMEREGGAEGIRRAGQLFLIWYHDVLSARYGLPDEVLANIDLKEEARRLGAALSLAEIGRRLRIVEEMLMALEQNVNPALALHIALGRFGSREDGPLA